MRRYRHAVPVVITVVLVALAIGGFVTKRALSPVPAVWRTYQGRAMGTTIQITIDHPNQADFDALIAQLNKRIAQFEARVSAFHPASEISHLNASAASGPQPVSRDVYRLIEQSIFYAELTHGAFDITFESVGHLYRWREQIYPDAVELAEQLPAVDYHWIKLDSQNFTVEFTHPHVKINLGGMAKGAIVDECIEWLAAAGIERAMVNAGGDSRVLGDRHGRPWRIGIRHPRQADAIIANLELNSLAVSTSGDYVRFFEEDDVRYHHIIDPAVGKPSQGVQSVTITGPEAGLTDALSTAVFVLGVEKGMSLVDSLEGVEALIIDDHGHPHISSSLSSDASSLKW